MIEQEYELKFNTVKAAVACLNAIMLGFSFAGGIAIWDLMFPAKPKNTLVICTPQGADHMICKTAQDILEQK